MIPPSKSGSLQDASIHVLFSDSISTSLGFPGTAYNNKVYHQHGPTVIHVM